MIGVCRASSSRKQSWPYGASITWSSTGLSRASRASWISFDADWRVQPVGAERDQQRTRRDGFERPDQRSAAVLPSEVEVGQRARGVQVGVGVEALDEGVGLVPQVALDLELRLGDREPDVVARLQPPAELVREGRAGQVGDVADHPGHAHPGVRRYARCRSSGHAASRGRAGSTPGRSRSRPRPAAAARGCWRSARWRRPGPGYRTAHSRACIPPREPPATAASRSMPSTSRKARSVRTMSATVITGKSEPYGRPVAGSIDDGPVVPRQPPSRLVETTKNRSVSKALPGPIIPSHQPRPLPPYAVPVLRREPVAGALAGRRQRRPRRRGRRR